MATDAHEKQSWSQGVPYKYHLQYVCREVKEALLKADILTPEIIIDLQIAAWLHDIIEDCPFTYNDIKKQFGEFVADIVYDCTDELGKSREERHIKTYPKLQTNPYAYLIKLADFYVNMCASFVDRSSMLKRYRAEYCNFIGLSEGMNFKELTKSAQYLLDKLAVLYLKIERYVADLSPEDFIKYNS